MTGYSSPLGEHDQGVELASRLAGRRWGGEVVLALPPHFSGVSFSGVKALVPRTANARTVSSPGACVTIARQPPCDGSPARFRIATKRG
ncbi:hypothetical protein FHT02_002091 [Sphingomonas xinjiangensis]|uniref:Uncharacterized protein n=1 Tax=Sphingomonas xinjiangensis TaxID=643568 RepID=A0A840YQ64_9SPHN|nr:hypothetical protein [Sphingomonas xinjiangensis]